MTLVSLVVMAIYPRMVATRALDDRAGRSVIRATWISVMPVVGLFAVLLSIDSDRLLHLLFGWALIAQSSTVLRVYSVTLCVVVLSTILFNLELVSAGRDHAYTTSIVIGLTFAVVATPLLTSIAGLAGAACGALVGQTVKLSAGLFAVARLHSHMANLGASTSPEPDLI